jgi:hypothetical protein
MGIGGLFQIGTFCGLLQAFLLPWAAAEPVELSVKPSQTDAAIVQGDDPHVVRYESTCKSANLLLFLPGTNGEPSAGPIEFYRTAVAQKYRLISLSYIDTPAVAQVCTAARGDPLCAEKFRQKRVFGEDITALISDTPADSIVNRLTKLLQYLAATDASGGWSQYLYNGRPQWERIAVAGQSQGGGMAAFIAKRSAHLYGSPWDETISIDLDRNRPGGGTQQRLQRCSVEVERPA